MHSAALTHSHPQTPHPSRRRELINPSRPILGLANRTMDFQVRRIQKRSLLDAGARHRQNGQHKWKRSRSLQQLDPSMTWMTK
ncbi:hypothetical protein RBWH47_03616 [Rhodopirellula baltica WH47]|uniref:Uncharacterized protein n=1 Tax=Rhodopirellula baltica WH47 TaxID=991778 RepID=F2AXY2_RHOBT|nr:hypothetical protein RBWH47_03616 [Rhodopirellula baltica WH47]